MGNVAELSPPKLMPCDRCNKQSATLKRVTVEDISFGGNRILFICPSCYQEHYWEDYNGKAIKR